MSDKRGIWSAGEGNTSKKAKTASDAGKSVSKKSQPMGWKLSEKSHATVVRRTSTLSTS